MSGQPRKGKVIRASLQGDNANGNVTGAIREILGDRIGDHKDGANGNGQPVAYDPENWLVSFSSMLWRVVRSLMRIGRSARDLWPQRHGEDASGRNGFSHGNLARDGQEVWSNPEHAPTARITAMVTTSRHAGIVEPASWPTGPSGGWSTGAISPVGTISTMRKAWMFTSKDNLTGLKSFATIKRR